MGGADPNNITEFVMKSLLDSNRRIKVIVGPAFKNKDQVKAFAAKYKEVYDVFEWPRNYAQIIASSRMVVTAIGTSIYEIAYLNIPILTISNYPEDIKSARILEENGYCKYIGYFKSITSLQIQKGAVGIKYYKNEASETANENGLNFICKAILNS
jgi:UDP-2,4-diacetamido-2,4,6-trideoxy-beta-L-altropyranose hydrolase